jgi:2-polyprenyl-3-methyl-5-hydroxy-6-metoxy-1,4-benzoquinol methylase
MNEAWLRARFARMEFRPRTDAYLVDVAARVPSHAFLGRGTLPVYLRQVGFLAEALPACLGCEPRAIHVLDWGCGKGHISYLLRQAGLRVTSADVAEGGDDSAFHQHAPILQEQGITPVPLRHPFQLPFADATFDCATSFGVLEHVPHDLESLRELRRVVKPDGLIYVSFLPYRTSWTQALARWRGDDYHDRLYGMRGVRRLAQQAGCRILGMRLGQLLPKNPTPRSLSVLLEPIDQVLCRSTPLAFLATNLEVLMAPQPGPGPR